MSQSTQVPIASHDRLLTLDEVLKLLGERAVQFLDAERCTIFLHDAATKQLWSRVAAGAEVKEIRVPEDSGLAGKSFTTGRLINVPDAYAEAAFNHEVDRQTGFVTRTILCCPILRQDTSRSGVFEVLNKRGGPFTPQDESMLDVFSGQAAITLQNALAEEALLQARTKEAELSKQLADNHNKLQVAFRDLGQQKDNLEAVMRRQRILRRLIAGAVMLMVGVMAWVWFGRRSVGRGEAAPLSVVGETSIERRGMHASVVLVGILEPIRAINLGSPFSGRVRTLHVKPGDRVAAGQPLVQLDTSQIDQEVRDLESRHIEARERLRELQAWASSRDVTNARRQVDRTKAELDRARVNATNTKLLLDRGVVSENEWRAAVEVVTNLETQATAATEDLAVSLKRGDADGLKIAQNAFDNIDHELARKRANRDRQIMVAPQAGVILRPPVAPGSQERPMIENRDVIEGEQLILLGQLDGFRVRARVDEADVLQLRAGQPVVASGAAFPGVALAGEIAVVSSQGQSENGVSHFDLEAVFPTVPPATLEKVLLGMSCDLRVQTYANDRALVVPLGAVRGFAGAYTITVKLPDGKTETRPIRTGVTSEGAVEILDGAQAGEKVVMFR